MTLNVAFMTQYLGSKAARSIFQESIMAFKDYNINRDSFPPNILIMLQCFHLRKEKKRPEPLFQLKCRAEYFFHRGGDCSKISKEFSYMCSVCLLCVCVSSSLIASIQDKATWLTSCFTEFCCSCILLINVEAFSFVEHISCSWSS